MPLYLNAKAKLWFEIGSGQGLSILQLFHQSPWIHPSIESDWAGHDRFFSIEIE